MSPADPEPSSNEPPPPTASARKATSSLLSRELRGALPCVRCGYNLQGLTVKGMCPECGTSVRTTLLAKIDPLAKELRPLYRPRLTAWGMVLWSGFAAAAALSIWVLRVADLAGARYLLMGVRWSVPVLAALSGVCSLVLVRPQKGSPAGFVRAALFGVAMYLPLVWVLSVIHLRLDVLNGPVYGPVNTSIGAQPGGIVVERVQLRVVAAVCMGAILIGLRPNARQLAARWLLMRVGAVDRQTMLVLVLVLALGAAGDGCLLVYARNQMIGDWLRLVGGVLIQVSSALFTLGLIGVVYDTWRLREVVGQKPLSLEDLVKGEE